MSASNASGSMTPWTSLARRAGEAKGPDREIDVDLSIALGECEARGGSRLYWLHPERGSTLEAYNPAYRTASVDEVLALISAKLPGWDWSLYYVAGRCLADISAPSSPIGYSEEAATPALALLSAFCLAMAAKAGEREPA